MRLIENKRVIIKKFIPYHKVSRIYWKEKNILDSNYNISYEQKMNINQLMNSDYLLIQLCKEINRK